MFFDSHTIPLKQSSRAKLIIRTVKMNPSTPLTRLTEVIAFAMEVLERLTVIRLELSVVVSCSGVLMLLQMPLVTQS